MKIFVVAFLISMLMEIYNPLGLPDQIWDLMSWVVLFSAGAYVIYKQHRQSRMC